MVEEKIKSVHKPTAMARFLGELSIHLKLSAGYRYVPNYSTYIITPIDKHIQSYNRVFKNQPFLLFIELFKVIEKAQEKEGKLERNQHVFYIILDNLRLYLFEAISNANDLASQTIILQNLNRLADFVTTTPIKQLFRNCVKPLIESLQSPTHTFGLIMFYDLIQPAISKSLSPTETVMSKEITEAITKHITLLKKSIEGRINKNKNNDDEYLMKQDLGYRSGSVGKALKIYIELAPKKFDPNLIELLNDAILSYNQLGKTFSFKKKELPIIPKKLDEAKELSTPTSTSQSTTSTLTTTTSATTTTTSTPTITTSTPTTTMVGILTSSHFSSPIRKTATSSPIPPVEIELGELPSPTTRAESH